MQRCYSHRRAVQEFGNILRLFYRRGRLLTARAIATVWSAGRHNCLVVLPRFKLGLGDVCRKKDALHAQTILCHSKSYEKWKDTYISKSSVWEGNVDGPATIQFPGSVEPHIRICYAFPGCEADNGHSSIVEDCEY